MKKRIYWHVGPWKTGSTSLQYFLFSNREIFEKNGYGLYYTRNPSLFDEGLDDIADYLNENGWGEWYERSLYRYINETQFDYYIVSEENMYYQGMKGFIDEGMKKALNENDLTIIITARRIDNVSLSLWKHTSVFLKGNKIYKQSINPMRYHYYSVAQGFLHKYPHATIKIRSYEYPHKGDIRKDFLHAIGSADHEGLVYDTIQHNPSATLDVIYAAWYLKDKYNLEPMVTSRRNGLSTAIIEYSKQNSEDPNIHILDRPERQKLIDQMKYSTEQCEKLYYDGRSLHPPLTTSLLYRPDNSKIIRVSEEIMDNAKSKGFEIFDLW